MGKLVRRSSWEPPVVKTTGVMNMGSSDPYASRDNAVKLVIAAVAVGAAGFMGFILYASGFDPTNISLSGIPRIDRSRRALESDVARLPELSGWLSRRGSSVLCDIHNGDIRLGVRELSPGEARQRLGLEKIRYSQEAQI